MMKIFHLLIRFQSIKSKEVRFRKLNFRSKRYIHDFFWFQIECTCAHARKSIIIIIIIYHVRLICLFVVI